MNEKESTLKCAACDVPLRPAKTVFHYLGMSFSHEVPRCPKCGQVYISKELAEGKMAEAEKLMEEK